MWIKKSEYEALKAKIAAKEIDAKNLRALTSHVNNLVEANAKLSTDLSKKGSEVERLQGLVREQTEADLLVNGLKAVGIIPAPKKYNAVDEQQRLMAIRQQAGLAALHGIFTDPFAAAIRSPFGLYNFSRVGRGEHCP